MDQDEIKVEHNKNESKFIDNNNDMDPFMDQFTMFKIKKRKTEYDPFLVDFSMKMTFEDFYSQEIYCYEI